MAKKHFYRIFTALLPEVKVLSIYFRKYKRLVSKSIAGVFSTSRLFEAKSSKKGNTYISFYLFFWIILVILSLTVTFLGYETYMFHSDLRQKRQDAQEMLTYWEKVLLKHPNFPDAYYNAAYYAAKLFDNKKAVGYLDMALYYDPSFKKAEDLKKEIASSYEL